MARSCNSQGETPALRAAIILSASTCASVKGEVLMCSVAVHSLPGAPYFQNDGQVDFLIEKGRFATQNIGAS